MQVLKIIALIIAVIGFYLALERKTKIKQEFIPITIISGITLVEFLAGILNLMKFISITIVVTGIVLAIYEITLLIKKKEKLKINIGLIILFSFLIIFTYLLIGNQLLHYDNFSHWGMIVKEMLIENRLPNFQTETIIFTSYPPATACFIYFICKFLGQTEGIMLLAQSMIVLASIYTIFALCKKEDKTTYLIGILSCIYLILGNIFIDELLVDTVLPVMGIAGLIIILYYKKDVKKGIIYSIPILSALMLVKNSGIFLVLVDLIVWLIFFIKQKGIKGIIKEKYVAIILVPFILQIIWNGHIGLVFEDAKLAKHSMSVTNYITNISEKGFDEIIFIGKKFIKEMISFNIIENIIMPVFIIYLLYLMYAYRKDTESFKTIKNNLIFMIITYIIYQISLLAMYIFSMPIAEAEKLASYIRYYRTILLFEYGIVIITTLNLLRNMKEERTKKIGIKLITIIMTIFLIITAPNKIQQFYKKDFKDVSIRKEVAQFKQKGLIPEEKSYLIYVGDDKKYTLDYLYHMWCYEYRSPRIRVIHNLQELESEKEIDAYEYFVVLKSSDEIEKYIQEKGGTLEENVIRYK